MRPQDKSPAKARIMVACLVHVLPVMLLAQNNIVTWMSFDMGYATPSSLTNQVRSVAGQLVVGRTQSSSQRIESGFLIYGTRTSGYPPNSGTFTVTTTNDSGVGSLRWALQTANATAGLNIITFNIPGSGIHTIAPLSPFADITEPVYIDGYSQPGSSPNTNGPELGSNAVLLIELNGSNISPALGGTCLTIRNGNSTIRGLVINRAPNIGIWLFLGSNNVVEGNFIGTDPSGTIAMGNAYGIDVETVGSNTRIGGTSPAARNVISGNTADGIAFGVMGGGGSTHLVQGNLIGTNAAGTAALGNGRGIALSYYTTNVLVGGTTPGAQNVISGNGYGVSIGSGLGDPNVSHNRVEGNLIGTNVTGAGALGNTQHGIAIVTPNNTVGGTTPEARNVISGNGTYGVYLFSADSNIIQGNYIGTNITGDAAIGNHTGGIYLVGNDVTIGGTSAGEGNIIAFNGTLPNHPGIEVIDPSFRNAILGNSIFENAGLGIDQGGNGVTPNDSCDADTLVANNYQNYPVLTSALPAIGNTIIQGTLNSRPNSLFRVEFFATPTPDSTGYGEGKIFLGSTTVTTGNNCQVSFVDTLPDVGPLGNYITSTATDAWGNTSEFSRSILLGTTSAPEKGRGLPTRFGLSQNYPNPFNPSTTINYQLPMASRVILTIYNILGQEVTKLVEGVQGAGYKSAVWNGQGVASGVYYCRIVATSGQTTFVDVKKMLVMK